jgi:hypothetical protein
MVSSISSEKIFVLVSFTVFGFPFLFWVPGTSTMRTSFTEKWIESDSGLGSGPGVPGSESSDMVYVRDILHRGRVYSQSPYTSPRRNLLVQVCYVAATSKPRATGPWTIMCALMGEFKKVLFRRFMKTAVIYIHDLAVGSHSHSQVSYNPPSLRKRCFVLGRLNT